MFTFTTLLLALPQSPGPIPAVPQEPTPQSAWELLSSKYDLDHDGRITRQEYSKGEVYFARLDRNEDGVLTEADTKMLGGRPQRAARSDRSAARSSEKTKFAEAGRMAPDFELLLLSPNQKVQQKFKLSAFAGRKPVALIFGSYT